ncbi:hypothetical protein X474_07170 [Dethiosulfatarculus sandiegensis]|uniref:Uncharacterized protein n=1 Tax=Dethiosulfatarculus sandiegensis TaxID=1429043 RepID=A0A0D2GJF6_9BACT|nr:hypothetical protein X474_07170 [Dethiosulfatarculus sandiegensis]
MPGAFALAAKAPGHEADLIENRIFKKGVLRRASGV